jgi:hypothetical protein
MRSSITWEDDATMKDWRPAIIDRFPSFDDYFLAVIEYNALELADLKKQGAQP